MFVLAATVGLGLLLVVGSWFLWDERLTAVGGRSQLLSDDVGFVTGSDVRRPGRIVEDRSKLFNLVMIVAEVSVLVMAAGMALLVLSTDGVATTSKALVGITFVVGAYLLARALYVRVGLPVPATDGIDDGDDAVLASSLDRRVAPETGEAFAEIRGAMGTTRGDGSLDAVAVALLAGARTDASLDDLREWAADSGVASPSTVTARADELEAAGVLAVDGDDLGVAHDRLADADPAELGTVAASLLA